ncbi:ribosome hibernation-promoting factor, HPF/YfiA family [Varunaivibrio sulfuroxidans]|uniref:Ribosome hibernation promoting factor n=1 Tax=Varunaivibrio sulfuroxidans TaxID=1773489 RepID=A0A4V2UP67_9PROT|nr:ribosome-associated translation inhibitor RaiA [Varunaivibrio sulfuroxidans]TCS64741.1 ribosomal subunit interface protein [Varunaivibrio sulfuroxidans]WES29954.1 ribosome-associated translation inhibitor RaiA [Varunaivibrio sulfuroxidans]
MDITVKGKQIDVGDSLRGYVEENLTGGVVKYFEKAIDATVVFSKPTHDFSVDITVHAGRGVSVQGHGEGADAHTAFDGALERISKQLRRYKRRLTDHHKRVPEVTSAQYAIIAQETSDEEPVEDSHPAIVAEMVQEIATLSVSEAVMRLDLGDLPVVVFRNGANGGVNVVYRRHDGNVGWVDPTNVAP